MTPNIISNVLSPVYQMYAKAITKSAAIACYEWIGKGNEKAADRVAVNAMRNTLNTMKMSARIVIGEGERDRAPMLYIGEQLGLGGQEIDIAVDPLEGTTLCAKAMPNSIAVIAMAPKGGLLHAPDVYMDKIVVGPNLPKNLVSLNNTLKENINNLAKAKKCSVTDLNICILDRDRHKELIAKIYELGARATLIGDGDVLATVATCLPLSRIDMYIGIGGAPEGVLSAAALKCLKGQMEGKLIFENDADKMRAQKTGIADFNRIYSISDMVNQDVIFCATGVTSGWLLKGVKPKENYIQTSHLILHQSENNMSFITDKTYRI